MPASSATMYRTAAVNLLDAATPCSARVLKAPRADDTVKVNRLIACTYLEMNPLLPVDVNLLPELHAMRLRPTGVRSERCRVLDTGRMPLKAPDAWRSHIPFTVRCGVRPTLFRPHR